MPRYFYLYSNEGDETIQNFGGCWDSRNKRWKLPFETSEKVYEYLKSIQESNIYEEEAPLVQKKKIRRKKIHRENSFRDDSFRDDSISDEEIH